MCWACTGYSAHGVQMFGCFYTSHFEQEMLSSTLTTKKQLLIHLCLTFRYWNGSEVAIIYFLLRKVIDKPDVSHM
jgi:hypothetical protein